MSEFPGVSITLNLPGGHMTVRAETPAQLFEQLDQLHTGLPFALARHAEVTSLDTPAPEASAAPAPRPIRNADVTTPAEVCPKHGGSKPSQYGGVFCSAWDDDTGKRCNWTAGKQRGQKVS